MSCWYSCYNYCSTTRQSCYCENDCRGAITVCTKLLVRHELLHDRTVTPNVFDGFLLGKVTLDTKDLSLRFDATQNFAFQVLLNTTQNRSPHTKPFIFNARTRKSAIEFKLR